MRVLVVSDIHYAGPAEKARRGWESRSIPSPALRWFTACYRRFFWLADPTVHNHQLDGFIQAAGQPDWVIANGDFSCDSAFVGVSDDAALASAQECLGRLRNAFGPRLLLTMGDHELGKLSLFGGVGGLRLKSWERSVDDLGIVPFWSRDLGSFRLIGVTSSLIALPAFYPEMLAEERETWEKLRAGHLREIREAMETLPSGFRFILFCHDPTALPYLGSEEWMQRHLPRLACTVIGHLHSNLILQTSRWMTGMPQLSFLGNTSRRLSGALRKARGWKPFRVVLCPSPPGIQLLKDGGFLELEFSADGTGGGGGLNIRRHRLPWR